MPLELAIGAPMLSVSCCECAGARSDGKVHKNISFGWITATRLRFGWGPRWARGGGGWGGESAEERLACVHGWGDILTGGLSSHHFKHLVCCCFPHNNSVPHAC